MERRKDTPYRGEKLPSEYLQMIKNVFMQNFSKLLKGRGKERETFVVYSEVFPDEVLVAVSMKNPKNLRMTTCYTSIDFPPPSLIPESGTPGSIAAPTASDAVQVAVNACIDVIGGFFQSYFDESRPVDYDTEYNPEWAPVDIDKTTRVYIKINRDNLELEAASDDFLARHEALHDRNEGMGSTDHADSDEDSEEDDDDAQELQPDVAPQDEESADEAAEDKAQAVEEAEDAESDEGVPELPGEKKRKKKTIIH